MYPAHAAVPVRTLTRRERVQQARPEGEACSKDRWELKICNVLVTDLSEHTRGKEGKRQHGDVVFLAEFPRCSRNRFRGAVRDFRRALETEELARCAACLHHAIRQERELRAG